MKKIILAVLTLMLVPAILKANSYAPYVIDRDVYTNRIEIFFNEDMNLDSINASNFILADYYRGTQITIDLYYSPTNYKVVIIPQNNLKKRYPYRLTIKAAVADIEGNQMGLDYVRRLTPYTYHNDNVPPQIGFMTGVPNEIKVVFTEQIKLESAYNSVSVKDDSGNIIEGNTSILGSTIYFNPDESMTPNKYYYVHIKDTIEDIHGNRINFNGASEYVEAVMIYPYL